MPSITKISEQRRRPNRRNVHLDGVFAFGCNLNVIARFRLREGMNLSDDQVLAIQQGEVRQECFDQALKFLQLRLQSRSEIIKKLNRREYGQATVVSVADQLVELGYLDDARFAKTRALSASRHKHHGRRRAKIELMKAGIGGDIAERQTSRMQSIYDSMTNEERQVPETLDSNRQRRIARGAGARVGEVNEFIKQFQMSRDMMNADGRLRPRGA
jgi:SOS response regulatory protein OraA/RecX